MWRAVRAGLLGTAARPRATAYAPVAATVAASRGGSSTQLGPGSQFEQDVELARGCVRLAVGMLIGLLLLALVLPASPVLVGALGG